MPARNDRPLKPCPHNVEGHRWELIVPMLKAKEAVKKESGFFEGCWSAVKEIRTGTDADGTEFIAWTRYGVALIGGPYERQHVAYKTSCWKCGCDAANLFSGRGPIQSACVNCRRDHHRAMHNLAARRRRRASGEVTTPSTKPCETCGESFSPKRSTARFCSTKCRVAAHRAKA